MKVSAKADYAVRAAAELAAAQDTGSLVRAETIATAQGIPQRFLENILSDLRHAGLVQSQRGAEGGHRLNRPAAEISVADIIRAVDGPLAAVRGERPESVTYAGPAEPLQRVWIAVRKSLRDVVEQVTSPTWPAARCRTRSTRSPTTPRRGLRDSHRVPHDGAEQVAVGVEGTVSGWVFPRQSVARARSSTGPVARGLNDVAPAHPRVRKVAAVQLAGS